MNRYDRDRFGAQRRGNRYDEGPGARPGGGQISGGPRGRYDAGMRGDGRRRGGYGEAYRGRPRDLRAGDRTLWGTDPAKEMTRGYSDFSPHGRFGGYYGAWDLRPMMAGYDAEMSAGRRRGRSERGR
jgi:hypothetical protein